MSPQQEKVEKEKKAQGRWMSGEEKFLVTCFEGFGGKRYSRPMDMGILRKPQRAED